MQVTSVETIPKYMVVDALLKHAICILIILVYLFVTEFERFYQCTAHAD